MNKLKNSQLYRLLAANFTQLLREPAVLFWGIGFPILMAWGLGIAFTKQGDVSRTVAIVTHNSGEETGASDNSVFHTFLRKNAVKKDNRYTLTLSNNKLGKVNLTFRECSWNEAYTLLKKGNVTLIVEDHPKEVKYHFDPANTDAQMLFQLITGSLTYGTGFYGLHQSEIKPMTLSGTRYVDFLIPGLLAMGVMMSSVWGISYSIIDRRSKKLLRRMVATPMKKSNFLLALMIARLAMNLIEAGLLFLFAWLYFGTTIQGSLPALFTIFLMGNFAFSGIAILIASNTANPEVGNGLINAVVTPMMVVSGVFISYHNFPDWILPFIQYLPLTLLADSVRSIFNEGAGFAQIWMEMLLLTLMGVLTFITGLKLFRWH